MFNYAIQYSEQLEKKEILLTLLPFNQSLTIIFEAGSMLCFLDRSGKKPDLSISFTPSALLAIVCKQDKTGLKMQGDAVLAQALEHCFYDVSMNWETFIEQLLGESFSYPVIVLLRNIHEKIRTIRQKTKNHVADYLQEDTSALPLPLEVTHFCNQIDELKLRVDRLEARFNLVTPY
jgi:ubiquinone biosynthesis accessory factor UbiJ